MPDVIGGMQPARLAPGLLGTAVLTLLPLAATVAQAQQSASPVAPPALQYGFGVRLIATDNARADAAVPRSDIIAELNPTLRYSRRGGSFAAAISYSGQALLYARDSAHNDVVNRFAAQGQWQAQGTGLSMDGQAELTQIARNPLTAQGQDGALVNTDRTDVATLKLAPRWTARWSDSATIEANADASVVRARHSSADSQSLQIGMRAASPDDGRRFRWAADIGAQRSSTGGGPSRESQSAHVLIGYSPDPDWRLTLQAGHEVNDYLTLNARGYATGALGVGWRPSPRTRVEWTAEHRFFGAAHSLRAEYRTPRTTWSLTDSREFTTDALGRSQAGAGAPRTVFDVLYAQFASIAPDPAQREALVDAFLQANGLTRTSLASGGFLTASASVQRFRSFSMAWNGPRQTLVFSLSGNDARRADAAASVNDSLANGNRLHSTAATLSVAHRLTPLASLNLDLTGSRSSSQGARSRFASAQAGMSWPFAPRIQASVGLRHSTSEGAGGSRDENALTFGLRMGF